MRGMCASLLLHGEHAAAVAELHGVDSLVRGACAGHGVHTVGVQGRSREGGMDAACQPHAAVERRPAGAMRRDGWEALHRALVAALKATTPYKFCGS